MTDHGAGLIAAAIERGLLAVANAIGRERHHKVNLDETAAQAWAEMVAFYGKDKEAKEAPNE